MGDKIKFHGEGRHVSGGEEDFVNLEIVGGDPPSAPSKVNLGFVSIFKSFSSSHISEIVFVNRLTFKTFS